MAVPENENIWLGGWINGLMVAVLLDLQEVARSWHRIQLIIHSLCRQWHLQSTVSKTSSESKLYLKCRTGTDNSVLPTNTEVTQSNGFVLWLAVFAILGRMKLWDKRVTRGVRDLQRDFAGKFSAKSLCFQPHYIDHCICKQISLYWWVRIRICSLSPTEARTCPTGEDTRKVSWAHTELHTSLQFPELRVTWKASSLWSISPWYKKASKTISAWRTSSESALVCTSSPHLSALVPQAHHWYPVKDTWLCIKAGSQLNWY